MGDSVASKEKLERYFIAYDGETVESYEVDRNKIVICSDEEWKCMSSGVRVSEEWVFDSVKAGEVQDTKIY